MLDGMRQEAGWLRTGDAERMWPTEAHQMGHNMADEFLRVNQNAPQGMHDQLHQHASQFGDGRHSQQPPANSAAVVAPMLQVLRTYDPPIIACCSNASSPPLTTFVIVIVTDLHEVKVSSWHAQQ